MLNVQVSSQAARRFAPRPALVALALAAAVGGLACTTRDGTPSTDGTSPPEGQVRTGLWGGDGILMRVTSTGATVEYDCAAGTIADPLRLDPDDHFEAEGLHSSLSGGPVDLTPAPERKPSRALYTGSTDGSSMTLTVVLTKTDEQVGRFELTYGYQPHLERCL